MLKAIFLASLLLAASTEEFDWKGKADRVTMDGALNNMAEFCEKSFGFARSPRQPSETMVDKIEAHLLLESSPSLIVERWAKVVTDWTQLKDKATEEAFIERLADALIAAKRDPDAHHRAERLYIETGMVPVRRAFSGCQQGSGDAFISRHYWSGTGSADRWEADFKEQFARSTKEL